MADKNLELLRRDPHHPSLRLKGIDSFWSARVGLHYRALARDRAEGLVWYWMGHHGEYERLIRTRCALLSPPPLGILLTGFYPAKRKPPRPRKPKHNIPAELRGVYAEVVAKAVELRDRGLTHPEVCDELNRLGFRTRTGKLWRHSQQIVRLIRSFGGGSSSSSTTNRNTPPSPRR